MLFLDSDCSLPIMSLASLVTGQPSTDVPCTCILKPPQNAD